MLGFEQMLLVTPNLPRALPGCSSLHRHCFKLLSISLSAGDTSDTIFPGNWVNWGIRPYTAAEDRKVLESRINSGEMRYLQEFIVSAKNRPNRIPLLSTSPLVSAIEVQAASNSPGDISST